MRVTKMQGKCSRVLKTRRLKNVPLRKRFYVRHMADKYRLSTMGVSKESISKFLIGNRFHVKLLLNDCTSKIVEKVAQRSLPKGTNGPWLRDLWITLVCQVIL